MACSQSRPPAPTISAPPISTPPISSPSMISSSARPVQLDQWTNTKAPLTSSQRASVNRLAEWLHRNSSDFKQQQSRPSQSQPKSSEPATGTDPSPALNGADSKEAPFASITLPDASAPLVSAQGFLAWYTQLSDSVTSSTQTSHRQALERISEATSTADDLLAQLEACQVNLSELRAGTAFVQDSSRGIREQAQALLDSQTHLDTFAEDIASRLSFFTLLPYATNMLSSPDSSIVYSTSFLELMDQLDMALLFLHQAPARSYRDAALYRMRYSHCLTRAATLAKMAVVRDIKSQAESTAQRVKQMEARRESAVDAKAAPATASSHVKGKGREVDNGAAHATRSSVLAKDTSDALFLDAAHQLTKLRPLIFELQKRACTAASASSWSSASTAAAEFESLLQECHTAWYQYRRPSLSRVLLQRFTEIEAQAIAGAQSGANVSPPIVELARAATELLRHVLEGEYQLYRQFFGGDGAEGEQNKVDAGLNAYLSELAETVTARLRPKLAKQEDLVVLAQTWSAISDAVHSNAADPGWSQSLLPLLNETQSRLSARAEIMIASDIAQFTPKEQDGHLEFPEPIRAYKSCCSTLTAAGVAAAKHRRGKSGAGLLNAALSASHAASTSKAQQEKVQLFTLPPELVSTYYPPVGYMLEVLFHLQARVSARAFRRIAVAAVEACLMSVGKGSQALLRRKQGGVEREDGWLFELRQLEILREAVVSAELVLKQAHDEALSINATNAGVGHVGQGSGGSVSLVDLPSLVNAINSLWTNTGRLLSPSSTTTERTSPDAKPTQGGQLDMNPTTTTISTKLAGLIAQIAAFWADAIIFPLRVYIDQNAALDESGARWRSTYGAFETCIESVVPEKAKKVALWVEDEEVQRMVVCGVVDRVGDVYGKFLQANPKEADGERVGGVVEMRERVRGEFGKVLAL
ncbi:related to conserved oligomeric Golgi complex component 3 [Ustilago sp. UG-2017b]|nr:related to conserved oligomeric Golgi complex component 3 [Ustilago sp. UG-2017b]